jgi:AraC-like DNA-binding protein
MRTRQPAAELEDARRPRVDRTPNPRLRNVVARDYAGFTEASAPHGHFVLPATTTVSLVLKLEDSVLRPPQFVNGAHGAYTRVTGECAPAYVELRLAPLGAYSVLGVPIEHLHGEFVDLGDAIGQPARDFADRVRDAPTWDARFALVDEFLLARATNGPMPSPEVVQAWELLTASDGSTPIATVAATVGWSNKHLITRFKEQIGLTPKLAARLLRFERVWGYVARGDATRWDQIAAESGYADQAHLIRDFRTFTGTTPAALAR